jgi:hypothetical protein
MRPRSGCWLQISLFLARGEKVGPPFNRRKSTLLNWSGMVVLPFYRVET